MPTRRELWTAYLRRRIANRKPPECGPISFGAPDMAWRGMEYRHVRIIRLDGSCVTAAAAKPDALGVLVEVPCPFCLETHEHIFDSEAPDGRMLHAPCGLGDYSIRVRR